MYRGFGARVHWEGMSSALRSIDGPRAEPRRVRTRLLAAIDSKLARRLVGEAVRAAVRERLGFPAWDTTTVTAARADVSFTITPESLEELRRKLPAAQSSRFALRELFDVPIYVSPTLNEAEIEELRAAWDRHLSVAVRPIDGRAFMYSAVEAEGERERKALALARRREAKQRAALAAVCAAVVLALAVVGFFWG